MRSGAVDTLVVVDSSIAIVSTLPGSHRNPSISQHQDAWREVQDVVAWEHIPVQGTITHLNVRSVFTETRTFNGTDQPDVIRPVPQLWGWASYIPKARDIDWLYPNVASITYRDSADNRKSLSTITHRFREGVGAPETIRELSFQWADTGLKPARTYTFAGSYPTNSETPTEQATRHALLYEGDTTAHPPLETSREFFFARGRPQGYVAQGRLLSMRMTDTTAVGHSFMFIDPWLANDTASLPLALAARDTALRTIAALATASALFRTRTFAASDSTWIGVSVSARFDGDTTGYWPTQVTYRIELVDASKDERVRLLDSFRISTTSRSYVRNIVDSLDLVSGTYYVRALIDTIGVVVPVSAYDSRYPVGEVLMDVRDGLALYRSHRVSRIGTNDVRVTAHPNPSLVATQIRFSVAAWDRVKVFIGDVEGRFSEQVLDRPMDPGRYAIDIDTRELRPGPYLVHVHVGSNVGVAKLLVSPE
jgi:hypothetical protein